MTSNVPALTRQPAPPVLDRRHGLLQFTPAVAALGLALVERVFVALSVFDDFCTAIDPESLHHRGSFEVDGHWIAFTIEHPVSDDAACDPRQARSGRVITLWLSSEA